MSAFDENRDGLLNRNEINDQREFQGGDFNRDGALNRGEFGLADNPRDFNRADTNRDGLVDSPEFARSEEAERRDVGCMDFSVVSVGRGCLLMVCELLNYCEIVPRQVFGYEQDNNTVFEISLIYIRQVLIDNLLSLL